MLKQIYEVIDTILNIPVLTQGIRSDIPILISQSDCRNSLDTLLSQNIILFFSEKKEVISLGICDILQKMTNC